MSQPNVKKNVDKNSDQSLLPQSSVGDNTIPDAENTNRRSSESGHGHQQTQKSQPKDNTTDKIPDQFHSAQISGDESTRVDRKQVAENTSRRSSESRYQHQQTEMSQSKDIPVRKNMDNNADQSHSAQSRVGQSATENANRRSSESGYQQQQTGNNSAIEEVTNSVHNLSLNESSTDLKTDEQNQTKKVCISFKYNMVYDEKTICSKQEIKQINYEQFHFFTHSEHFERSKSEALKEHITFYLDQNVDNEIMAEEKKIAFTDQNEVEEWKSKITNILTKHINIYLKMEEMKKNMQNTETKYPEGNSSPKRKMTLKLEMLENWDYVKKHKSKDISLIESNNKVKINLCKDLIHVTIEGDNVSSAKKELDNLMNNVKTGSFPLDDTMRLENEGKRKKVADIADEFKCSMSVKETSSVGKSDSQQAAEFGCWTTCQNQTLQMMCGDLALDQCDVLVVPVLETSSSQFTPSVIKTGKFSESVVRASREINKKKTSQIVCNDQNKTPHSFIFTLLPQQWNDGKEKEKERISKSFKDLFVCLKMVEKKTSVNLVIIDLQDLNSFPFKKIVKPIIDCFKDRLSELQTSCHFILSVHDPQNAIEFTTVFDDLTVRNEQMRKFFLNVRHRPLSRVSVILADISKLKCDAIVNTVDPKLTLRNGNVSKCILKAAGTGVLQECIKNYPDGIKFGAIAKTGAGKLSSCDNIYHGALLELPPTDGCEDALKSLCHVMKACFDEASTDKKKAIAFPVLSTGILNYRVDEVAKCMFDCAERFFLDNAHSSIEKVLFVVHPKNEDCIQVFIAEEIARSYGLHSRMCEQLSEKKEHLYVFHDNVMLQIISGDVSDCTATNSGGICVFSKGDSGREQGADLLPGNKEEFMTSLQSETLLRTHPCPVPLGVVIHCWAKNKDKLEDVIKKGLKEIAKEKLLAAQILLLPMFKENEIYAVEMINSIINAMTNKKNKADTGLHLVSLIISDQNVFDTVTDSVNTQLQQKDGKLSKASVTSFSPSSDSDKWFESVWNQSDREHIVSVFGETEENITTALEKMKTIICPESKNTDSENEGTENLSSMNPQTLIIPGNIQHETTPESETTKDFTGVQEKSACEPDMVSSDPTCILLGTVQSLNGNMDSVWKTLAKNKHIPAAILYPHPLTLEEKAIIVFEKSEDVKQILHKRLLSEHKPQELQTHPINSSSQIERKIFEKISQDKKLKWEFKDKTGLDFPKTNQITGNFFQLVAADNFFHLICPPKVRKQSLKLI